LEGEEKLEKNKFKILLVTMVVILSVLSMSVLSACSSTPSTTAPATSKPATTAAPATTSAPATTATPVTTSAPVTTTAPATSAGPSITLKWTTFEPDAPGASQDQLRQFAKLVETNTQGRIKIQIFWGAVLGKVQDTLKILQSGVADGAFIVPTYHQWEIPLYAGAGLPFITTGFKVGPKATWALYQEWPAMQQEWVAVGVKPLYAMSPHAHWLGTTISPMTSINDLKGKKMWVGGFWPDLVQQFGIAPVPLSAPEAYDGLQKGTISGVINPYHTFKTFKYYEVLKTMCSWPFGGQPVNAIGISLTSWNKISAADQKVILDISATMPDFFNAAQDAEAAGLTQFFKDNKLAFVDLPQSEIDNIAKVGKDVVWNSWLATAKSKNVPGQEFLDRYIAMVAKVAPTVK
jgi:TRAP-type C4-dicarboxylate transport system substrate-binding protein